VDYLDGGYQYKNGMLTFIPTAEGYVDVTPVCGGVAYNYIYQYKDHLGNVRVNYTYVGGSSGQLTGLFIKEENHYYPFGLQHGNYNVDYLEYQEIGDNIVLYPPLNANDKLRYNYKYLGQELQDELGLNMYDYGARNYDPALGRWMNIDPKAETSRRWSPYAYCYNNPMYFVDPDGMQADDWYNKNGQLVYDKNKGTYTKHATAQEKQFGEALRTSGPDGQRQFDALTQSDAKIKVDIKEGISTNYPGQEGFTTIEDYAQNSDGTITLKEATIEVFLGTITDNHGKIMSGEMSAKNFGITKQKDANVKTIKDNNLSIFEMAVAVLGHEIDHTKNKNVEARVKAEQGVSTGLDPEFNPERVEGRILDDLAKKKKQE
jgi:RHS repeat-associated protein